MPPFHGASGALDACRPWSKYETTLWRDIQRSSQAHAPRSVCTMRTHVSRPETQVESYHRATQTHTHTHIVFANAVNTHSKVVRIKSQVFARIRLCHKIGFYFQPLERYTNTHTHIVMHTYTHPTSPAAHNRFRHPNTRQRSHPKMHTAELAHIDLVFAGAPEPKLHTAQHKHTQ